MKVDKNKFWKWYIGVTGRWAGWSMKFVGWINSTVYDALKNKTENDKKIWSCVAWEILHMTSQFWDNQSSSYSPIHICLGSLKQNVGLLTLLNLHPLDLIFFFCGWGGCCKGFICIMCHIATKAKPKSLLTTSHNPLDRFAPDLAVKYLAVSCLKSHRRLHLTTWSPKLNAEHLQTTSLEQNQSTNLLSSYSV